jgi:hypothetical protein
VDLQRMGKKPVLKVCMPSDLCGQECHKSRRLKIASCQRNFGILSILGFSCAILSTWEGMLG